MNTSTFNVEAITSKYSTFRDLMQRSANISGVSGLSADAIFCSFQPTTQKGNNVGANVYLGFKRIPDSEEITHADFLEYIKPGNAAIIMKTELESQDEAGNISAGVGHYTCAWKESEEDAYYYFDSEFPVVHCLVGWVRV